MGCRCITRRKDSGRKVERKKEEASDKGITTLPLITAADLIR
jgi:hypothetical protein